MNFFITVLCLVTLNGCWILTSAQQTATDTKVIIIGAGISGYSAAAKLIENGIDDLIILETENRIGGRIHSIPYAGGFIDIGGQWVHGENGNSIYELASGLFDFGDTGFESASYYYHQSNGVSLNQTIVGMIISEVDEIFSDYERLYQEREPFGDFFHRELTRRLRKSRMAGVPFNLAMSIEDFYQEVICSYFGLVHWNRISPKEYLIAPETEGNGWLTWRNRGYRTLFDIIESPREGAFFNVTGRVQLNKRVVEIHWNDENGRTRVVTDDGSIYTANHVICTVSLGFLKAHHESLFRPRLPNWKVAAIQHIAYGSLEKVIMEFQQPFWPVNDPNWVQYSILWTREDITSLRGTDREWLVHVKYIFRVDAFPNLLSFFLIGERFANFATIDNTRLAQDVMWLLQRTLNRNLNPPINVWRSCWICQPGFLGAYSYLSIESTQHRVTPKMLGETLMIDGRPNLLFAGEATDKFYGYANGALSSGYRAAEEIVRFNNCNRLSSQNVLWWFLASAVTFLLTRAH